jgi:sorbitol/mannitol transport system substrate-binding protein
MNTGSTLKLVVVLLLALGVFVFLRPRQADDAVSGGKTLTVATVNNADMIIMQRLSKEFEEQSGIEINWVVLEENVLRQRVTMDIAMSGGQFDVITIGSYETPIWGKLGWLTELNDLGEDYDYDDLLEPVRNSLSVEGSLYAVPFYAESSFTYYRSDLFEKAGLVMPDQPTYEQIEQFAALLHDPDNGIYGICLRGKPGWGENMAFVGTLINTFGGRWFDMDWKPCLDSPEWHEAISFYVRLLNQYGPPGSSSNGHNECRALFATGKCAIWIDATSAAGFLYDRNQSEVADRTAFARAPIAKVANGAGWSWAWALGIPATTKQAAEAKQFVAWATSKEYVARVAEVDGWTVVPPGTRKSTYARPEYLAAAPFAESVEQAIMAADPDNPTEMPVPYTGIQYVAISEFQGIGAQVGKEVAAALTGRKTVEQALQTMQSDTERAMTQAGY